LITANNYGLTDGRQPDRSQQSELRVGVMPGVVQKVVTMIDGCMTRAPNNTPSDNSSSALQQQQQQQRRQSRQQPVLFNNRTNALSCRLEVCMGVGNPAVGVGNPTEMGVAYISCVHKFAE